jgi:2-aminoadipate transaminase
MIAYDKFFSRAGALMQESAIRKMGTILSQRRDLISFAPGYPAPETFPWQEYQEIARDLLNGTHKSVLQYGATRGIRPLLEAIAAIEEQRGIHTALDRLLVTTGSQQGLDLVTRVLVDPGDIVLVERPTYTGAISAFRNGQAELAGVNQEADGIELHDLEEVHARLTREGKRIAFLYVVPNFQNPTGLLMGPSKRTRLLEWAQRRDILIVEDDPYRELYFEDSAREEDVRPIKADDPEGRVIYLSSFSKTLAPGFRVAWIDAPSPIAVKLEMAKQAADLMSGSLDQRMVLEAYHRGILQRQLPLLRQHYQEKRNAMVAALRREMGPRVQLQPPRGGFFVWAALPRPIDADVMIARAVDHGVIYVAGQAFFVDPPSGHRRPAPEAPGTGAHYIRLAFSAASLDQIREGVTRLAGVVAAELEALDQAAARTSSSPRGDGE